MPERDALGLGVEADHLDLDVLADIQRFFGGVIDPAARAMSVTVQQAVDPAQIDKGAVIGDVLDDAVQDLAFLEAGDQLPERCSARLSSSTARREHRHDVAARAVHLQNLERLLRAQQRRDVAHRANVDLAARQKGDSAAQIDGKPAP